MSDRWDQSSSARRPVTEEEIAEWKEIVAELDADDERTWGHASAEIREVVAQPNESLAAEILEVQREHGVTRGRAKRIVRWRAALRAYRDFVATLDPASPHRDHHLRTAYTMRRSLEETGEELGFKLPPDIDTGST